MDFDQIVSHSRSCRRFDQSCAVPEKTLRELVDLARKVPAAGNRQPLRYAISCRAEINSRIFATLRWAAHLKDWPGPSEGERPSAYIVMLTDKPDWRWLMADAGIAAQTILLAATTRGLGGCMMGGIRKEELAECLEIPGNLSIVLVIALGKPVEKVVLEEMPVGGSTEYYRTPDAVHHVPKRSMSEVLLKNWS